MEHLLVGKTWQKELVTQLCQTLCDSIDCSPPGSSVHGIHQARILEWVAIPFSRPTQGLNLQADFLPSEPRGKPILQYKEVYFIKVQLPQNSIRLLEGIPCQLLRIQKYMLN